MTARPNLQMLNICLFMQIDKPIDSLNANKINGIEKKKNAMGFCVFLANGCANKDCYSVGYFLN